MHRVTRHFIARLLTVILTFYYAQLAISAEPLPQSLFLRCYKILGKLDERVRTNEHVYPVQRTVGYKQFEKISARLKKQLSPKEYEELERWYFSNFFFSPSEVLLDTIRSPTKGFAAPNRYDRNGERPFEGYLQARSYIMQTPLESLNIESIQTAQKTLMSKDSVPESKWSVFKKDWAFKKNSEGAKDDILGLTREKRVGFTDGDDREEIVRPTTGEKLEKAPINIEAMREINPLLGKQSNSWVDYAPLSQWRRYQEKLTPPTVELIKKLEATHANLDLNDDAINPIRKQVIQDLLSFEIDLLRKNLNSASNTELIIDAVGNFHYQLLSIHPFMNGNGRVTRLLTERILAEYNLPPPIWSWLGEDVVHSKADFIKMIKDGVALSEKFHFELETLAKAGIDPKLAPSHYLATQIHLENKNLKSSPEEFLLWASKTKTKVNTVNDAIDAFEKWKTQFSYEGEQDGIRLATPFFKAVFNRLSPSKEFFELKRKSFYSDNSVYRGLSLLSVPTDQEMIDHFSHMKPNMFGMGLDTSIEPKPQTWDEFNEELVRSPKQLRNRLADHVAANSGYWNSHFISFTRDRAIAKNFKDGFLMGKDHQRQMQATFEIEIAERKIGSVDVRKDSGKISAQGYENEKEVLFFIGVEPESVNKITVEDLDSASIDPKKVGGKWGTVGSYKIQRRRVAERVTYNTILLRELDSEGRPIKHTLYEIQPDESSKIVGVKNDFSHGSPSLKSP